MDFPSYLPHAVRASMARLLEGEEKLLTGWNSALASAEADLTRLQQQRDEPDSNELRIARAEATERRDHLAADVACCQRLLHDARMQPAYARLVSLPNVTDSHLSGFIYAALAARMDYAKHREQVNAADDLALGVAKAAGALADLLRKAEGFVGPRLPSEFFSIQSLLEKTEHDVTDRDFYMWPGQRRVILGEALPALEVVEPADAEADGDIVIVNPREPMGMESATPVRRRCKVHASRKGRASVARHRLGAPNAAARIAPAEASRDALRYAWGTAPSMARIIATMQHAATATAYTASESGHIAAALASRQHSAKTAYLRAFGALLRDVHRMDLTPATMNAMATAATVVLNESDLVVTYDDVRKATMALA